MTLKIFGVGQSACTRRVAVVCKELDIPYEIIPVDVAAKEHKSEKYLAEKQPFGVIPVINDDGFQLYESRAIGRYLATKYGNGKLIPKEADLEKRALFEQAASIEQNNFEPYASAIVLERFFKPVLFGQKTNEENAAQMQATLEKKLEGYEAILARQKYLAGDEISLADLFHLPYGHAITTTIGMNTLKATPNVARWWADISSRPSWQAVKDSA